MIVVDVLGISVAVDAARTRQAYARIGNVAEFQCQCAYCQNYRVVGITALPIQVHQFFELAGIDPNQPAETFQYNEVSPGRHLYGGEYYFFGEAPLTDGSVLSSSGKFDFTFTQPSPLAQDDFQGKDSVCLSFTLELPWVLSDAP